MKRSIIFLLPILLAFTACKNTSTKKDKVQLLASASDSKEADAALTRGLTFYDLGDAKKARAQFLQALDIDPKMAIAYIFKANTDQTPKEFADDLAKAKANLGDASEWEKLFYEYNATQLEANWDKRLELAQKMVKQFPDDARSQLELGNTYLAAHKDAWARDAFEKTIQMHPNWVGGYVAAVNSYLFSEPKDFKKAEEYALKTVNMEPSSPGAMIALGDCYRAQNDLQRARDAYGKAIEIDPNEPVAYYKKGHANSFLGNYDEARQNYMDGAKHDDLKFAQVSNIANTWLYAGDYKKALEYVMGQCAEMDASKETKDVIAISKFNALSGAAEIAMHNNDVQKLREVIAQLDPAATQVGADVGTEEAKQQMKAGMLYWNAIADILEAKYDDAISKLQENRNALEIVKDPTKFEQYEFAIGFMDMKKKDFAKAIDHFEKTNTTADMYCKYWLAMANEAAGNKDKANNYYKEMANYNFNDIGYALIRNEVRKKVM